MIQYIYWSRREWWQESQLLVEAYGIEAFPPSLWTKTSHSFWINHSFVRFSFSRFLYRKSKFSLPEFLYSENIPSLVLFPIRFCFPHRLTCTLVHVKFPGSDHRSWCRCRWRRRRWLWICERRVRFWPIGDDVSVQLFAEWRLRRWR